MIKALIKTADNMSSETYNTLCEGVKRQMGCDINFEREIDNMIIGGFIMYLDGMVYDYSLSSQLDRLKEHIGE